MFEYGDPGDFRRQTMQRMMKDFAELAERHDVNLVPATIGQIAAAYREAVPVFTTEHKAATGGRA